VSRERDGAEEHGLHERAQLVEVDLVFDALP
jgi:hypothetical protein